LVIMGDRLVTIKTFSQVWEAELSRATLKAEGIPAFIADANTININWLYSNLLGGVKLQVPESYVEAAKDVLSSLDESPQEVLKEDIDSPACPKCGKHNSTLIRLGRRWTFLTWLLFGFPLFFPPKRRQCLECGMVWKNKEV